MGYQVRVSPTGAGFTAFDALSDLEAFPASVLVTGLLVFVTALGSYWSYAPSSTATPDGVSVVAANGGGNWIAEVAVVGMSGNSQAGVDANSLTRGPLYDPWWTFAAPNLACKVYAPDEVNSAGFIDGALVNPYADAPAGGLLAASMATPPGVSGNLTFSRIMKTSSTLGNPAATVVLIIYDAALSVVLASQVCVLTNAATKYSVTLAGALAVDNFALAVVVNNTGLGSSAQAQFEDFGGACTFSGGSGVFSAPYNRLQVSEGALQDNLQKFNTMVNGYIASPFSVVTFDTDATTIGIEYIDTFEGISSFPSGLGLAVRVNGRPYALITPTNAFATLPTLTLPAGIKRVEVVGDQNYAPEASQYGGFIRAIYAPATNTLTFAPVDANHRRMICYGDSITCGSKATPSVLRGYSMLIRQQYPGRVAVEAFGSRTLTQDCSTAAGALALALKMQAYKPDEIWDLMGLNDWAGPSPDVPACTAAQFQTYYGNWLTAMKTVLPGCVIWACTPIINANETTANTNGEFLRDFREAKVQACIGATNVAQVVYGPALMPAADLTFGDANHPTNTGHDVIARAALGVLGMGPSEPSPVTPTSQASMTCYDYWEADLGLTLSGSNVTQWVGQHNGYVYTGSGAAEPLYTPTVLNGLGTITFNGTEWLVPASHALSGPLAFCIVLKATTIGANGVNDVVLDSLATSFNLALLTDNTPETYAYSTGQGAMGTSPAASVSTTEWSIIFVTADGTSTSSQITIFTQANPAPTSHITNGNTTAGMTCNGFTLGASTGHTRGMKYALAGFYVWSGAATASDQNTFIEGYVKPKFGL